MSDPRLDAINSMRNMAQTAAGEAPALVRQSDVSFQDMMKQYINDANDLQIKADNDIKSILAGEEIDPHTVMIAMEKATMSFDLVMEVRNKMLEAYREILRSSL